MVKDKRFWFNFLYVALIIGVIIFMMWMVFWLKSEGAMCMREPLQYYIDKTGQNCFCHSGLG